MQPVMTEETEWKLDRFVEIEGGPLPLDKYSFNQKVREVVQQYRETQESDDGGWMERIAEMRASEQDSEWYRPGFKDAENAPVPEFSGETRRPVVKDDLVDEIEEIAASIQGRDVSDLSFDEQLLLILETWGDYARMLSLSWKEQGGRQTA